MPRNRIYFLLLLYLLPICLYAQNEKRDTVAVEEHKKLITAIGVGIIDLKDELVHTVRDTGRKIRKEVKDFNAIDTTNISPNLYNLAFKLEHSTWY